MKILWHSVKPTIPSGYGTQTKLIVPILKGLGHEVAISCSVGTMGATEVWNGFRCFPSTCYPGKYGMDSVRLHADKWGADVVISWLDAFVINADASKKLNWAAWVPVDSEPLMPRNLDPLKSCKWTMAPTKWGVRMLQEAGFADAMLLPCLYNPKEFYPMPDPIMARLEFGRLINKDLSGKFLVNVVSANSGERKNFQAIFQAWKLFHEKHPNSILYLHTDMTGYFSSGMDLPQLAKLFGVDGESILFVSQWEYSTGQIANDYLHLMYNASDVHLNTCFGEGFGLPIMDAQACGCPTIVPNFAAAGEIGLCYKVNKGNMTSSVPGALQFDVDVGDVVAQLERAYDERIENRDKRETLSARTSFWQVQNVVENYLIPVLERIEGERK